MTEAPIDQLRGLLDVARAARSGADLQSVLDTVAGAISRALGYRTVVINLRRRAWDDFEVVLVLGSEEAREMLLGVTRSRGDWDILLQERFERHGAYFLRAGDFDWSSDRTLTYVPEVSASEDADAYEAMTADRPYRRALPAAVAQEELRANGGGRFHPAVVDAFLGVLAAGGSETLVGVARA